MRRCGGFYIPFAPPAMQHSFCLLYTSGEVFPDAKYQRCTVHFYRNVFSIVPRSKVKIVAKMLKAIHAQESKKASREKAKAVVAELRAMKLKEAAKKVEDGIEETLTYCDFPSEHWTRIRTNNVIERLDVYKRQASSTTRAVTVVIPPAVMVTVGSPTGQPVHAPPLMLYS